METTIGSMIHRFRTKPPTPRDMRDSDKPMAENINRFWWQDDSVGGKVDSSLGGVRYGDREDRPAGKPPRERNRDASAAPGIEFSSARSRDSVSVGVVRTSSSVDDLIAADISRFVDEPIVSPRSRRAPPRPTRQGKVIALASIAGRDNLSLSRVTSRNPYPDGLSIDSIDDDDVDLALGARIMALTAVDREFAKSTKAFQSSKPDTPPVAVPSILPRVLDDTGEYSKATSAISAGLATAMKSFQENVGDGGSDQFATDDNDLAMTDKDLPYTAAVIARNLEAAMLPFKLMYVDRIEAEEAAEKKKEKEKDKEAADKKKAEEESARWGRERRLALAAVLDDAPASILLTAAGPDISSLPLTHIPSERMSVERPPPVPDYRGAAHSTTTVFDKDESIAIAQRLLKAHIQRRKGQDGIALGSGADSAAAANEQNEGNPPPRNYADDQVSPSSLKGGVGADSDPEGLLLGLNRLPELRPIRSTDISEDRLGGIASSDRAAGSASTSVGEAADAIFGSLDQMVRKLRSSLNQSADDDVSVADDGARNEAKPYDGRSDAVRDVFGLDLELLVEQAQQARARAQAEAEVSAAADAEALTAGRSNSKPRSRSQGIRTRGSSYRSPLRSRSRPRVPSPAVPQATIPGPTLPAFPRAVGEHESWLNPAGWDSGRLGRPPLAPSPVVGPTASATAASGSHSRRNMGRRRYDADNFDRSGQDNGSSLHHRRLQGRSSGSKNDSERSSLSSSDSDVSSYSGSCSGSYGGDRGGDTYFFRARRRDRSSGGYSGHHRGRNREPSERDRSRSASRQRYRDRPNHDFHRRHRRHGRERSSPTLSLPAQAASVPGWEWSNSLGRHVWRGLAPESYFFSQPSQRAEKATRGTGMTDMTERSDSIKTAQADEGRVIDLLRESAPRIANSGAILASCLPSSASEAAITSSRSPMHHAAAHASEGVDEIISKGVRFELNHSVPPHSARVVELSEARSVTLLSQQLTLQTSGADSAGVAKNVDNSETGTRRLLESYRELRAQKQHVLEAFLRHDA